MKLHAIAFLALALAIIGCSESPPPKSGVRVDAPGVKVDVETKGDKKVDVDVKRQ